MYNMAEVKMNKSSLSMSDFPSNSLTSPTAPTQKTERPKPTKVISGNVTSKKPGIGRKFADIFLGEEVGDVKSYILQDVVVPTIKNTIIDVVCGGVEMLLLGRTSGRRYSGNNNQNRPRTAYGSYYNSGNQQRNTAQPQQPASRYGIDDIIFTTHGEASDVLAAMFDYMKDYDGMISVADFYEMVGHPSAYTDNYWGWTDLGGASVRHVRDGYLLVLPRVVNLK